MLSDIHNMIGSNIGHYTIRAKIGEGGMGEVYRASDSKLQREVALKILPEGLAADPQYLGRFEREAHVLASLNHSHIASIYGLEECKGGRALIMELIEGEDLADRLKRGRLPVEEAASIAMQIAEALEFAHEKGIIHRDLKPGNVKTTLDGQVKVLDFGLAKALEGDARHSNPDLTNSPTLSLAATQAGMILGTAAYMSPEQASGLEVDKRSDIWSFGVVLFEMLSGRRLFSGETVSHTLADVLRGELDWSLIPADIPVSLRRLLERCLERNPRRRLRDIGEARLVLEDFLARPDETGPATGATGAVTAVEQPAWRRILPWGLFALSSLALFVLLGVFLKYGDEAGSKPMRLNVVVGGETLNATVGPGLIISPGADYLAYVIGNSTDSTLYARRMDQLEGVELVHAVGAEHPYNPFFSPDGKWVGYATPAELRKIPISGGTPLTLCSVERSRGATWGPDDTIVFAPNPSSGLLRVRATGGTPETLTTLDASAGEATHRWPQFLPGGKAVLFTSHSQVGGNFNDARIEVVLVESGERKIIHRGGFFGRYLPSGHLAFMNGSTLFAVPFDLETLETTGSPAPVVQNLAGNIVEGAAQLSFSNTGALVYLVGQSTFAKYPVVWVDRTGRAEPLLEERGTYATPRISPDGKRLSLTVQRDNNWDVWVYDLERGVSTRLTFEEATETEQIWSPDGESLVFSSDVAGADNLYMKRADGSGETVRLTESDISKWATSWSSDGRIVAFSTVENGYDIGIVDLERGEGESEPFLESSFAEEAADFSPDDRWIAYSSTESGRAEVYVRPYPARGGKWQVSDGGGNYPRWSADGRELFFRTDQGVMVAQVEISGDTFRAGKPELLFDGSFRGGVGGLVIGALAFADYDVAPDGEHFVMFPSEDEATGPKVEVFTLVLNWFDELKETFGP